MKTQQRIVLMILIMAAFAVGAAQSLYGVPQQRASEFVGNVGGLSPMWVRS